jgi:ubiquinone/menaquinone biosynthesis C-methylase UbiE
MPIPDSSIDVIVSFETVEHLARPSLFIQECTRVLAPGGTVIMSTPNRDVYSEQGHHNRYHYCEMDKKEFTALLNSKFNSVKLYAQRLKYASPWSLQSVALDSSSRRGRKGCKCRG